MTAGYSGTPLAKKLSLKDGLRTWWLDMPDSVRSEILRDGLSLNLLEAPEPPLEAVHLFVRERAALDRELRGLLPLLAPAGFIWVSWPKKAARIPTDITEETIREIALPLGLVDVKVCAIDDAWSGLKLVIRKELRQ